MGNAASSFVVCTQTGIIHVYDFDAKKILYSHDIILDSPTNNAASNNSLNPTINCVDSNGKDKLFVGLSNGLLLSFDVYTDGIIAKQSIVCRGPLSQIIMQTRIIKYSSD